VQKGDSDLGIITQVEGIDTLVSSRTIWVDKMHFVSARQHPLSTLPSVSLKDLSLYQALLPERRFYTTKLVEALFVRDGLDLKINLSTNFLETIKALISAGYAWGVLPDTMLQDDSLAVLPVADDETGEAIRLSRNLDCIYHQQRSMSNAGKAFFDLLCARADPA
jgi:DNA-binding transcriptional LysR family regulator